MNVVIRPETAQDHQTIHDVTMAAFATVSYGDGTEAGIIEQMRDAGDLAYSFVAEKDGEVVGQVSISPAKINDSHDGWFAIGPISVRPDLVNKGIGSTLMRQSIEILRSNGAAGVVLTGNPTYYTRFGFENDCGLTYLDVPAKYVHRLVLNGPVANGTLAFAPGLHGA